ncbi:MAG: TldD/PmbA family protein [Peptoniphilaceae bacterium]|nr:TldD/PmbA family protein [Peptoniphilaceae bacterium]MDY6085600.1 TldD/PmbA family protein [Peptoniphilaceae bacterium]
MPLTPSEFLQEVKPQLREIVDRLAERYPYASLLATDVDGVQVNVLDSDMAILPSPDRERGFVVRVQTDVGFTEYSFNTLDVDAVVKRVDALVALRRTLLETADPLPYPGVLSDEPKTLTFVAETPQEETVTPEEALRRMVDIHRSVKENHPELANLALSTQQTEVNKMFLSPARDLTQTYQYGITLAMAMAHRDAVIRSGYAARSGVQGLEILDALPQMAEKACTTARDLLDAERMTPGEYDIISDPDFTGLIAHEAFGHGTEMDMFVKHRAKGAEYLNKRVASDAVRMHDGAAAYDEVSSYAFDDEGTLAGDTLIIDDGIFRQGMADALSALYLGVPATGNGKRESYKRKAYTRMTNTFFEAGETSLEDLMADIEHGYLLESFNSGMEDPKNWGIQCVASHAREIRNGKLTGKVFAPVYLTGYVPDLLQSITAASPDLVLSGSGYCGKGWKEWVKTSTGGSYVRAKGRLS